jgi:aminopeptidase
VDHLRLRFVAGRVVEIDAPDAAGADVLRQLLAVSTGAKDVIAEFAIGLNPGVTEPIGDIGLDEKIGGSVHIAIGMNANFGGRNKANLHKDLVILSPTVWLDDVMLVDQGVIL